MPDAHPAARARGPTRGEAATTDALSLLLVASAALALLLALAAQPASSSSASVPVDVVVNPTCLSPCATRAHLSARREADPNPSDGLSTLLPTDLSNPCLPVSDCLDPSGLYTNSCVNAGCDNWVCSLRANCGCFAGQVTSCVALNLSSTAKAGCSLLIEMFEMPEMGCSWADYLGARPNDTLYKTYLEECMAGCSSPAARRSSAPGPGALAGVAAVWAALVWGSGDGPLFR